MKFLMRLLSLTLVINPFLSSAQVNNGDSSQYAYWIDMMQDPVANFFETQKAFEKYWEGKTPQKGDGWKVFKRWEHFMEQRVDENGNKPKSDHVMREYVKYFSDNKRATIQNDDSWVELGPIQLPANGTGQPNGLGRVNCIAFHPTIGNTYYVGAPSGGVWKTENNGITWLSLTDTLPTLGVSSIVVDYSNANVVYLGTGDRDGSDAPGLGVWKSTDAGLTWNVSNSGMGNRVVGRLIQNPLDSMTLMAATNSGIYKTVNGGQSWVRKTTNTIHYKDLVFKPNDTSHVYATASGDFYRSTDGGETWSQITSGLPTSNRMVIGVTKDNSNVVYVMATNQKTFKGMYKSSNSGTSFSVRSTTPNIMDYSSNGSGTGGQAWYDLCIAIDPLNEDIVYAGGVNVFKSINGGSTWTINGHWVGTGGLKIHADQHELAFSPVNGLLYSGNDGGLHSSTGSFWTDRSSGLGIAQIYKIGQSVKTRDLVINGYQDNGTAIYSGSWKTEIGGDGMECIIDPVDDNYMYGSLYYGAIRRSSNKGTSFSNIYSSISETGEWVTPFLLQEGKDSVMFAGFKSLWRSTNVKTFSSSAVTWTKITSYMGAALNDGIRVMENSSVDNNIMYIAVEDKSFHRSDNVNSVSPNFVNLKSSLPTNTWPKDIEAHHIDINKVYIVQSNKVYQSSNKGMTWTNISGTLPNVSINCIVIDTSSQGNLYVGTDLGVFFKGYWMSDWIPFNNGLPNTVEVTELEIYYNQDRTKSRIRAATYGRGLWSSVLYIELEPDFHASPSALCVNGTTKFTDRSEGFYTKVDWTFTGGSPSTSTDESPMVTYSTHGAYEVKLKISNDNESKTVTKTAYIVVDSNLMVDVTPHSSSINRGDSVKLVATGALNYFWSPTLGLNLTLGDTVYASPMNTTKYTVVGSQPLCPNANVQVELTVNVVETKVNDHSFLEGHVKVYPNPVDKLLMIDFENVELNQIEVRLLDITGKLVLDESHDLKLLGNQVKLNTSSLDKGVYFLSVLSAQEQVVFRVLVDHSF